jgi:hypothetical protein
MLVVYTLLNPLGPFEILKTLTKTSNDWNHNTMRLLNMTSVTCGYYCVYFILLMSRGLQLDDILVLFDDRDSFVNDFRISKLML